MTLVRTGLRLCVVEALRGAADARPTIAEGRIYDSRMDDISPESFAEDAKATIIVLTDNDEGSQLSEQNGGPPFHRMIEVTLEMGMTMSFKDGSEYVIGYPDTDARLEASLDLLEFQAIKQLAVGLEPLSILFRQIARITKYENHRQVLNDAGVKMAARVLTLTCHCNDDQIDIVNTSAEQPTGLQSLPPTMQAVCELMPNGSSGAVTCAAIAAQIAPITAGPFSGIDATLDANHESNGDPQEKAKIDVEQLPETP